MLFESDPILRTIKQIAQMVAALAGASGDVPDDLEVDDALGDAYLGLLGLDRAFAESLTPDGLLRMLHDPAQREALVELLLAHGDLLAHRGDAAGASRQWARARAVVAQLDAPALAAELEARDA